MANEDKRKPEPEVLEAKAKDETCENPTGLVKMHKAGNFIDAHPSVVKEHEKNGWKAG